MYYDRSCLRPPASYMYAIELRDGPPPVLGVEAHVAARLRTDAALVLGRGVGSPASGSEYGRAAPIGCAGCRLSSCLDC